MTLHACKTQFLKYFDYVLAHGGDPNFRHRKTHQTPLIAVILSAGRDKKAKVKKLIELGANSNANIDDEWTGGETAVDAAVATFGQFDIALLLLESGADYKTVRAGNRKKLVHLVVMQERRLANADAEMTECYQKLVKWLEDYGESVDAARADVCR